MLYLVPFSGTFHLHNPETASFTYEPLLSELLQNIFYCCPYVLEGLGYRLAFHYAMQTESAGCVTLVSEAEQSHQEENVTVLQFGRQT